MTLEFLSSLLTSYIKFSISSLILASIQSFLDFNDEISNNYLVRFGTKARQEKTRFVKLFKTQFIKIKNYHKLRHYKRHHKIVIPVIMRIKT